MIANDHDGAPAAKRRSLVRFAYDFWTKPIRPEPVACFRILAGCTIFISLLTSVAPDLRLYAGPDGLVPSSSVKSYLEDGNLCLLLGPESLPPSFVKAKKDDAPPRLAIKTYLSDEQIKAWNRWGSDYRTIQGFFVVLLFALACMTLGLWTRTATIVSWAMFVSLNNRLPWLLNGGDSVMRVSLFYLMISPSGAAWSIDSLRRSRKNPSRKPAMIPPWSVRLMQIQLCLIYFFTGLSKCGWEWLIDPEQSIWKSDWFTGEAVYWVLHDISLVRWPYHAFPIPMWACRIASWGTLVFELGFPLFVSIRFFRPWILLAGLSLHAGIWLSMEVGWFGQITMCWYVLFLSGDMLERVRLRLAMLFAGATLIFARRATA